MNIENEFRFGFLPHPISFKVGNAIIEPVDNFEEVKENVLNYEHYHNGFYYPPPSIELKFHFTKQRTNAKPSIPSHLSNMPPSHRIRFNSDSPEKDLFCKSEGGLLIHLLGLIYDTRLQFADWEMDGRVKINESTDCVVRYNAAEANITHVHNIWSSWDEDKQKFYITALYLHNRAISYNWEWERFLWEYIVLDLCWWLTKDRILQNQSSRSNPPHRLRLIKLIKEFKLAGHNIILRENGKYRKKHMICVPAKSNKQKRHQHKFLDLIVKTRNNLVHEGIWVNETPGFDYSNETNLCTQYLRKIVKRLLLAIGGVDSDYVRNDWADRNRPILDEPKKNRR